jgi:hypothetical protein
MCPRRISHQEHGGQSAIEHNNKGDVAFIDDLPDPKELTNQIKSIMSNLSIHIIVYAEPSLRPHEAHVAMSVYHPSLRKYYIYHVVEDVGTESEMKFERQARDRDPRGSTTPHQEVPISSIPVSKFEQLNQVLQTTGVPRPKPLTWNCQTWLRQAMQNVEAASLVPRGAASGCYAGMMSKVNANTTRA